MAEAATEQPLIGVLLLKKGSMKIGYLIGILQGTGNQKYHYPLSEYNFVISIHQNKFKCTHFYISSLGSQASPLFFTI